MPDKDGTREQRLATSEKQAGNWCLELNLRRCGR